MAGNDIHKFNVRVDEIRERSFKCTVSGDERPFYLPRKKYVKGAALGNCEVEIPEWLRNKHRQLAGDEIYESETGRNRR